MAINVTCPYCKKWARIDKSFLQKMFIYCWRCNHIIAKEGKLVEKKEKK